MAPGVLRRLHGQDFVRQGNQFVARAPISDANEVDMAIHQAGQNGGVAVVELADGRALRRVHRFARSDAAYGVVFEQDGGLLGDGAAVAVYETVCFEDGELGGLWHSYSPASSLPAPLS